MFGNSLAEAEAKILKAKTALITKHPFISILALGLIFRNAEEDGMWFIDTMATDGKHVWWNTEFVNKLSVAEVTGVIAHEVMHCVWLHMLRRGVRDPFIWNIATDAVINITVPEMGFVLPPDGVNMPQYRDWLAEDVYEDMIKNQPPIIFEFDFGTPCPDGPSGNNGSGKGPDKGDRKTKGRGGSDKDPDKDGQKGGGSGTEPDKDGQEGSGKGKKKLWGTFIDPRNEDGTQMSDADKAELFEEIKIKVVQAAEAAKAIGKLPASMKGLIKAAGQPKVDWKNYIQQWVKGSVPDDYSWKRPNRKMMANYGLYMPQIEMRGAGIGVLSIDQSGSVSNEEQVKYATEITGVIELCNPDKLYIILHDAEVAKVYEWERGDTFDSLERVTCGGTCITPSFEYAKNGGNGREGFAVIDEPVNWMICFTDMAINDYPKLEDAPDFPVLWAATGPDNAPFGTYISLKDPYEAKS